MAVTAPGRHVPRTRGDEGRHLRVVDPPRRRGRRGLVVSMIFIGFTVILLATVTFHVRLVTGQQRIDRLDRRAEAAQQTYDRLRERVDRLSAPERIVARARSLGMVQAEDPTWLAPTAEGPDTGDDESSASSKLHDYLDVKPFLGDDR